MQKRVCCHLNTCKSLPSSSTLRNKIDSTFLSCSHLSFYVCSLSLALSLLYSFLVYVFFLSICLLSHWIFLYFFFFLPFHVALLTQVCFIFYPVCLLFSLCMYYSLSFNNVSLLLFLSTLTLFVQVWWFLYLLVYSGNLNCKLSNSELIWIAFTCSVFRWSLIDWSGPFN